MKQNLTETPVPTKTKCRQNHRFSHRHWRQVHLQYRLRITSKTASGASKKQRTRIRHYLTTRQNQQECLIKRKKSKKPTIQSKNRWQQDSDRNPPDIPFQILSFRINGKECDFYWHGKKSFWRNYRKKPGKPWKAELMGFVKSGKLYYETMDLTEKQ